ncbi:MAG: ribosomal protein L7/L12 [Butyricicoccaceae bacterium]
MSKKLLDNLKKERSCTVAPESTRFSTAEVGTCRVILLGMQDNNKVKTIKLVREITGMGLVEAKNCVEHLPQTLLAGITPARAEEIRQHFAQIGAEVRIERTRHV